jgi:hypothetical protein
MIHFKVLEKQKQVKLETSRRKEIIKVKPEINQIKTKRIPRINETKS